MAEPFIPAAPDPDGDTDPTVYSVKNDSNENAVPGSARAALVAQAGVLGTVGTTVQGSTAVMLNSAPAVKKVQQAAVAELLPEVAGVGYKRSPDGKTSQPFNVTLVRVGGFLMEKTTGYDFILMRGAAFREQRVELRINSAFRSHEEQQRLRDLYLSGRGNPASEPGFSGHEQGYSLDIHCGIAFEDWKSGAVLDSVEHAWLMENALRFGFSQKIPGDLGVLYKGKPEERAFEPWHWTHFSDGLIYGVEDKASDLVGAFAALKAAHQDSSYTSNGEPDWMRIALKVGSDASSAWTRSALTASSSRVSLYDATSAQRLLQSAELQRRAANQLAPLNLVKPLGFAGDPPLYNFDTGRWSDEESNDNARGV